MDVDRSVPGAHCPTDFEIHEGKENVIQNSALATPTLRTPGTITHALSPSAFGNRNANPSPERQKPTTTVPMDISLEEEKLVAILKAGRFSTGFAEGVRRESFPGNHLHAQDLSFNYERAGDEQSVGNKLYLQDDGMSVVYERCSTPIRAHEVPLPVTVQRTSSSSGSDEPPRTARMAASHAMFSESDTNKYPFASPTRPETINASPVASFKSRTVAAQSRLGIEQCPEPEVLEGEPSKTATQELKLDFERGLHFALPEQNSPTKWAQPRNPKLSTIAARAAALQFLAAEETFTELDSIIDVQLPEGAEDEFTAAFGRLKIASPNRKVEPEPVQSRQEPVSPPQRQEPTPVFSLQLQESTSVHDQKPSTASCNETNPAGLAPASDQADGSYVEDEHTLNIASLGLSEHGNTLLMDTSLDQLRSNLNDTEPGDGTFGGSSFAIPGSSVIQDEGSVRDILEAKTPKIQRNPSNPLSDPGDVEIAVQATVKKSGPRLSMARVVSDAVVDDLRSGRALHKATASIASISDRAHHHTVTDGTDEFGSKEGAREQQFDWPGSTASLRRVGSTGAHQRTTPGTLQRTQSTTSLYRTNSTSSHHRAEASRPHSRASIADTELEVEDEPPYIPSAPAMSRISSRRSSVYAYPEHDNYEDRSPLYPERPTSVASIRDRPPSAASIRPTSAASIRPPSATSIRSSARPTSNRRLSSGAYLQQTGSDNPLQDDEDDLVRGMEALMMKGDDAPKARLGRASIAPDPRQATRPLRKGSGPIGDAGGATRGGRVTSSALPKAGLGATSSVRPTATATSGSGARSGLGLNALKKTSSLGLAPKSSSTSLTGTSTLGTRALGAKSSTVGISAAGAKTVSAATSRTAGGLGTRSSATALRSQPTSAASTLTRSATVAGQSRRPRASTLGLFAPDGGPGADEEPKRPTHKASSASISSAASATRSLRPPQTSSSVRSISRGTANTTAGSARAAGSIASLREVMKSRETISRR